MTPIAIFKQYILTVSIIYSIFGATSSLLSSPHESWAPRQECGKVFEGVTAGVILSPNFPGDYPPLSNCTWEINLNESTSIRLHFEDFEVDESEGCRADYLEIVDIQSQSIFCGVAKPSDFVSQHNTLTVKFISDNTQQSGRFFKIVFNAVPWIEDVCIDNPCMNGGTCVADPSEVTGFQCECQPEFSGTICECNPCDGVDCGVGGECIALSGCGDHKCVCALGFVEIAGECVDVNECLLAEPCHPDATCNNTVGSFQCECNEGFQGDGINVCDPTLAPCPAEWEMTYPGAKSCYRSFPGAHGTFDAAQGVCSAFNGNLVCIEDEAERSFFSTVIVSDLAGLWLGMTKNADGTEVTCLNGGTPLKPFPWYPGQPNDNGLCLYARPYQLAGRECSSKFFPLCETPRLCFDKSSCPSGFEASGDSCYKAVNETKTFDEARTTCQSLEVGADLAILSTETELVTVLDTPLMLGGPYWVGLKAGTRGKAGFDQWIDGTALDFNLWAEGEPVVQDGCGLVGRGHWGDSDCEVRYDVVCELARQPA